MNINRARLPKIYKRNGRECYLDPIRKRLIYITPEESVRQRMISFLMNVLNVPAEMLQVEEHISHYGVESKKRADIIILAQDRTGKKYPITVVECKAETVPLDEKAVKQAFGYSRAIGSDYVLLINGGSYMCYKYDSTQNQYIRIKDLPNYKGMLERKYVEVRKKEPPERIPYRSLKRELRRCFIKDRRTYMFDISKETPMELALPAYNLLTGLMDERIRMPKGDYGLFELVEDYGVRNLTYGNAGGGKFNGRYRSFLVRIGDNTEFFSIGLATYWKASWVDNNRTYKPPLTSICVAHDDEKTSHHSLQLIIDEYAVAEDKTVRFYHNGRIAIGKIGSGKKSELRDLVAKRYPKILTDNDKYYLGSITADHLLRLDEPDVIDLIVNLISYAIVRDEYREIVKARKR